MTHAQRTQLIHTLKRKLSLSEESYLTVKLLVTDTASAAHMNEEQHTHLISVLEESLFERQLASAQARYNGQTNYSDEACLALPA